MKENGICPATPMKGDGKKPGMLLFLLQPDHLGGVAGNVQSELVFEGSQILFLPEIVGAVGALSRDPQEGVGQSERAHPFVEVENGAKIVGPPALPDLRAEDPNEILFQIGFGEKVHGKRVFRPSSG